MKIRSLLFLFVFSLFFLFCSESGFSQTITSAQDGPWNSTSTWVGGTIPTAGNSTSIDIQHNVNIPGGYTATADEVIVRATFSLTIDAGGTLDLQSSGGTDLTLEEDFLTLFLGANLIVNGTFINNSLNSLDLGIGLSTTNFNDGSSYIHAINGGSLPFTNVSWSSNSTCEITGSTNSVPGGMNQTFGNFNWNCSSHTGSLTLGLTSTVINGDFQILNTNSTGLLVLASSNGTIDINGDFIVSGPSRFLGSVSNTIILDVEGNFEFSSTGSVSLFTSTGSTTLNLSGDFSVTSGTLNAWAISSATTNINFDRIFTGSNAQNFIFSGGSLNQSYNYTVNNNSALDLGTSVISGTSLGGSNTTFTLASGARLYLGALDGGGALQSGSSGGNITIPDIRRTFSSGSTIIFNGSSAQFVGNGWPPVSGVNLEIDNSAGVSLSISTTVTVGSELRLTNGILSIGAGNTLVLEGTIAITSGGLAGGSSSNLTILGTGPFGTLTFTGTSELLNFTLNRTSSGSVLLGGDLTMSAGGTFTQSNGDLNLNGFAFTIDGNFSQTGGNIVSDNSSSQLIVTGAGTLPGSIALDDPSGGGDCVLGTLTMNRDGETFTTGGNITVTNLNLTDGVFDNGTVLMADGGTITRGEGSMTSSPTVASASESYNMVYTAGATSAGPELPPSFDTYYETAINNFTKQGSSTLTLSDDIFINGDLTLTNGTLESGSTTINLDGDFVCNSSPTLTGGTVEFAGTTVLTGSADPDFDDIIVTGDFTPNRNYSVNGNIVCNGNLAVGTGSVIFSGNTAISGTTAPNFNELFITGTLTANTSPNINVAGDFNNNGTFDNGGGTVVFNGSSEIIGSPDFHNIRIDGAGTLLAPTTLNIAGNFENDGIFTHNNGTVVFNGSATQNIGVNSLATTTFYDISANNDINIEGGVNLARYLTLGANVTFDADGNNSGGEVFTLLSTSETNAAGILAIPGTSSVTGNVTFQRFIDEGTQYTYFGFPVNGITINDLQNSIPITGPFTGASSGPGLNSNFKSFYFYDETVAGDLNLGWVNYPTTDDSAPVNSLTGYASYSKNGYTNPVTISIRGTINQGNSSPVDLNPSYTTSTGPTDDGWNLVVNPYPCAIDWQAVSGWTKSNIDGVAAIWTGSQHIYSGSSWDGIVAPGQAFWVKATASPALTASEDVKVNQQGTFYRTAGVKNDLLILDLQKGNTSDKAYLYFKNDATDEYDNQYDARKLGNSIYNLSTYISDDQFLAVNNVPFSGCSKKIGVNIDNINAGNYTLNFSNLEYFTVDAKFTLIDHFLGVEEEISEGFDYHFSVTSDTASKGKNRFELIFEQFNTDKPSIAIENDALKSSIGNGNQWFKDGMPLDGENNSTLNVNNSGIYHLSSAPNGCEVNSGDLVLFVSDEDQILDSCSNSMMFSLTDQFSGIYNLKVVNISLDDPSASAFLIDHYLDTEIEILGETEYNLSVNAEEGSYNNRFEIYLTTSVRPEIQLDGNKLISSHSEGNQWYRDNVLIEGAIDSELVIEESGTYHVEVTQNGCAGVSNRIAYEARITGIEDEQDDNIQLYPNPGTDIVNIRFPNSWLSKVLLVQFIDMNGKIVLQKKLEVTENNNTFDVHSLKSGYFTILIENEDIHQRLKFLKR